MTLRRLDEQFAFTTRTPILDNLNNVLKAIEVRLQSIEALKVQLDAAINSVVAVGLARMNDVFTPLIQDAQARLEEFGANFIAHSATSLTLGLGTKILSLDEADRPGYVYADYVALRHVSGSEFMIGRVSTYDRENGQLIINVESYYGSGTFADWNITISVQPDISHETDYNNPHQTTAAQVGAYSEAQTDSLLAALNTAILNYIGAFNLSNVMHTNENLAGLGNPTQARANINLGNNETGRNNLGLGLNSEGKANARAIIGVGTAGDAIPLLNTLNAWTRPQSPGTPGVLSSGVAADLTQNSIWTANVNGGSFTFANPSVDLADNTMFLLLVKFTTANSLGFGNKFKVNGYTYSSSGIDALTFMRDSTANLYYLVGVRNGVNI